MRPEASQTLSTTDVPPAARLARWNDFGSETLASMVADPADRDTFRACITRRVVGCLGFTWMSTSAATARGYGGGVGAWAAPTKDAFLLLVQEHGQSRTRQSGREAVLKPGDMVLLDASRPHITEAEEPMSMVMLKLPIEPLLTRVSAPDALAGVGLSAERGPTAFASSVLLSVKHALADDNAEDWSEAVSDIILDALGMSFGRVGGGPGSANSRLVRRRDACAYIEQHFDDPDLSVAGIAEALGVTVRHLQRLFLKSGATPRQYVLDRRLDAAAQLLRRSADAGGTSITDIALGVGFNDLSYFTRSFVKKHGFSPREYRRVAAGQAYPS